MWRLTAQGAAFGPPFLYWNDVARSALDDRSAFFSQAHQDCLALAFICFVLEAILINSQ
jgi:hypothetical protein